jgi:hypothetical protein
MSVLNLPAHDASASTNDLRRRTGRNETAAFNVTMNE